MGITKPVKFFGNRRKFPSFSLDKKEFSSNSKYLNSTEEENSKSVYEFEDNPSNEKRKTYKSLSSKKKSNNLHKESISVNETSPKTKKPKIINSKNSNNPIFNSDKNDLLNNEFNNLEDSIFNVQSETLPRERTTFENETATETQSGENKLPDDLRSGGDLRFGNDLRSGDDLRSGGDLRFGDDLRSGGDLRFGNDLRSGGDLRSGDDLGSVDRLDISLHSEQEEEPNYFETVTENDMSMAVDSNEWEEMDWNYSCSRSIEQKKEETNHFQSLFINDASMHSVF